MNIAPAQTRESIYQGFFADEIDCKALGISGKYAIFFIDRNYLKVWLALDTDDYSEAFKKYRDLSVNGDRFTLYSAGRRAEISMQSYHDRIRAAASYCQLWCMKKN